jgi:ribosomal-protein-alanine N-acetyltransferase
MSDDFVALTEDNYQSAFRLQSVCHSHPWSENVFSDSLNLPYFAFQLFVDQRLVGYCIGLVVLDEATLMDIGVCESHRGRGYGKKLLQHFTAQCANRDVVEVWLEVRQSNDAAIRLYSENGYQIVETRKNYYPINNGTEHALIMKSVLPKST